MMEANYTPPQVEEADIDEKVGSLIKTGRLEISEVEDPAPPASQCPSLDELAVRASKRRQNAIGEICSPESTTKNPDHLSNRHAKTFDCKPP